MPDNNFKSGFGLLREPVGIRIIIICSLIIINKNSDALFIIIETNKAKILQTSILQLFLYHGPSLTFIKFVCHIHHC